VERSLIPEIEKAIRARQRDETAVPTASWCDMAMPASTQETRQELGQGGQEDVRGRGVACAAAAPTDANEMLKELLRTATITEDDERKGLKPFRRTTDKAVHPRSTKNRRPKKSRDASRL